MGLGRRMALAPLSAASFRGCTGGCKRCRSVASMNMCVQHRSRTCDSLFGSRRRVCGRTSSPLMQMQLSSGVGCFVAQWYIAPLARKTLSFLACIASSSRQPKRGEADVFSSPWGRRCRPLFPLFGLVYFFFPFLFPRFLFLPPPFLSPLVFPSFLCVPRSGRESRL